MEIPDSRIRSIILIHSATSICKQSEMLAKFSNTTTQTNRSLSMDSVVRSHLTLTERRIALHWMETFSTRGWTAWKPWYLAIKTRSRLARCMARLTLEISSTKLYPKLRQTESTKTTKNSQFCFWSQTALSMTWQRQWTRSSEVPSYPLESSSLVSVMQISATWTPSMVMSKLCIQTLTGNTQLQISSSSFHLTTSKPTPICLLKRLWMKFPANF